MIKEKDNLLSVIDYARKVGVTRTRIYALIEKNDNRIWVVMVGGRMFINPDKSIYRNEPA